jgi:hypothetical protein
MAFLDGCVLTTLLFLSSITITQGPSPQGPTHERPVTRMLDCFCLCLLFLATRAARACWNDLRHAEDPSTRQSGPVHTAIVTTPPSLDPVDVNVDASSKGNAKFNATATLQGHNKIIHNSEAQARRKSNVRLINMSKNENRDTLFFTECLRIPECL